MRVLKYLTERNISLASLNMLCEYLNLNSMKISSKIQESKIVLFDEALDALEFQHWKELKNKLVRVEVKNSKALVNLLSYNSNTIINEILAEQIINAVKYLIKFSLYSEKGEATLLQIIDSDKPILDKIFFLKKEYESCKRKSPSTRTKNLSNFTDSNDNEDASNEREERRHHRYRNYRWGDLDGEAAHIGKWNTD